MENKIPEFNNSHSIAKPPRWIYRWGIYLLALLIFVALLFAAFVKYPDIIKGSIVITSTNPPANLVSHTEGRIIKIFKHDNETVKAGDYILMLENSANLEDILKLKSILNDNNLSNPLAFSLENDPITNQLATDKNKQLGTLQASFNNYIAAKEQFEYYLGEQNQLQRVNTLKNQLKEYELLAEMLLKQVDAQQEKLNLLLKKKQHDELLAKDKVLSQADLDNTSKLVLEQEIQLRNSQTAATQNTLAANEIRKRLLDLSQESNLQGNKNTIALDNAINQLKSDFYAWEEKYVVKAPINGTISFYNFWQEQQQIKSNEPLLAIVREQSQIFGRAKVNLNNSGKLRLNQKVHIKLLNYPYLEFGMIEGKVDRIAQIPIAGEYAIEVSLPNGLTTTYKKTLPLNEELIGEAEIIVDDITLLQRILYPLKHLWNKQ
jgi:HlyD family secretion protein